MGDGGANDTVDTMTGPSVLDRGVDRSVDRLGSTPLAPDVVAWEADREARRGRVIALASQIHAAEAELVGLITDLGQDEAWAGAGYLSLSHWLGVNAGFTPAEASRRVRIAERTTELPALAGAAGEGRISVGLWDRATAVATPDLDAAVAEVCALMSPSQALRTLATYRRLDQADPDPEPDSPDSERTWLRKWWDDRSRLHVDGCLDALDGARFETALAAATALGERDPDTTRTSPVEAFARMAEVTLDDATEQRVIRDGTHFAVEVVFDVDTATGRLDPGPHLSDDDLAQVFCDTRMRHLTHQGGVALNVGRDVRTAPRALRRALRLRDGGCAFPGCGQTRFVHAHHIVYWEHGGGTDLDNLVLLCGRHHRLLHHGAYTCEIGPDRRPRFADPNGRPVALLDGREPPVVSPRLAWHQRQRHKQTDPRAARCRSGGEPLTAYALDIILHNLLTTTRTTAA